MKAIVNVNKKSAYAKYNGLTFEVESVLSQQVALAIPNAITNRIDTVDFGHSEVLIVDIKQELNQAVLDLQNKQERLQHCEFQKMAFDNLFSYCKKNKIQL